MGEGLLNGVVSLKVLENRGQRGRVYGAGVRAVQSEKPSP
jgi:hypothetical protein